MKHYINGLEDKNDYLKAQYMDTLRRQHFWREVFFAFRIVYPQILIGGFLILAVFMTSLYIKLNHPYSFKNSEAKSKQTVESTKKPDTENKKENVSESKNENTGLSKSDFQYIYRDYKITYKGKKGVKKEKAEKLLEKYLYTTWDNNTTFTPGIVKIEGGEDIDYKVLNVRKGKNKIIAYLKLSYHGTKIFKATIKGKNGQYNMEFLQIDPKPDSTPKPTPTPEPTPEPDEDEYYDEYDEYDDDDYYSDYIIPYSDTKKLTRSDIEGLTKVELRLARNEIYARHGRRFNDEELQAYFDAKDWYDGWIEPEDFIDSEQLTKLERRNAKFIKKFE